MGIREKVFKRKVDAVHRVLVEKTTEALQAAYRVHCSLCEAGKDSDLISEGEFLRLVLEDIRKEHD